MAGKNKKYFPIKTKTACQLKWAWSTVTLQLGTTQSCHRVSPHTFDINSFNFHNTTEKIAQRETMLRGEWPDEKPSNYNLTSCYKFCGKIEEGGVGQSDRQFFLDVPNLSPYELDTNLTATNVSPTVLEIYVDNTCNLSCLYCIPELSSRIDFEMKKYGRFDKNGLVLESTYNKHPDFDKIQEKFWEWMRHNVHTLSRLHLLGGEPFYQQQFELLLEFFETVPCPNLEFNIVTNLMLSLDRLTLYTERIKKLLVKRHLKTLDITVSIDCWGPQQEFVRYGLSLTQWEQNFKYLLDQRWIKLNINNTISILTIKTLPELLNKLNVWAKNRKIEHYFSTTIYPSYMHPAIIGPNEFKDDFEKIILLMESETWRGKHAHSYMEGIVAQLQNSVYNNNEMIKLLTFLDEIDRRRNTNWRELFPWLAKYENVVQ